MDGLSFKRISKAAREGDHVAVYQILQQLPALPYLRWDSRMYGYSPLMEAAYYGHYHVAEILIKKGFRIHDVDRTGATALFHAAVFGQASVIGLLLQKGANGQDRNKYGYSPLMVACANGHIDAINTILQDKLRYWSPNALQGQVDLNGEGLLHIAAHYGHVDVLHLLVEEGPDLHAQDASGRTPMDVAREANQLECLHFLESAQSDNPTAYAPPVSRKVPRPLIQRQDGAGIELGDDDEVMSTVSMRESDEGQQGDEDEEKEEPVADELQTDEQEVKEGKTEQLSSPSLSEGKKEERGDSPTFVEGKKEEAAAGGGGAAEVAEDIKSTPKPPISRSLLPQVFAWLRSSRTNTTTTTSPPTSVAPVKGTSPPPTTTNTTNPSAAMNKDGVGAAEEETSQGSSSQTSDETQASRDEESGAVGEGTVSSPKEEEELEEREQEPAVTVAVDEVDVSPSPVPPTSTNVDEQVESSPPPSINLIPSHEGEEGQGQDFPGTESGYDGGIEEAKEPSSSSSVREDRAMDDERASAFWRSATTVVATDNNYITRTGGGATSYSPTPSGAAMDHSNSPFPSSPSTPAVPIMQLPVPATSSSSTSTSLPTTTSSLPTNSTTTPSTSNNDRNSITAMRRAVIGELRNRLGETTTPRPQASEQATQGVKCHPQAASGGAMDDEEDKENENADNRDAAASSSSSSSAPTVATSVIPTKLAFDKPPSSRMVNKRRPSIQPPFIAVNHPTIEEESKSNTSPTTSYTSTVPLVDGKKSRLLPTEGEGEQGQGEKEALKKVLDKTQAELQTGASASASSARGLKKTASMKKAEARKSWNKVNTLVKLRQLDWR